VGRERVGEVEVQHARLDPSQAVLGPDLEDAVHSRGHDDERVAHGVAAQAKPMAEPRASGRRSGRDRPDLTSIRKEVNTLAAPGRPGDVALCFDVEDIFRPPEGGNDDSIKELGTIHGADQCPPAAVWLST